MIFWVNSVYSERFLLHSWIVFVSFISYMNNNYKFSYLLKLAKIWLLMYSKLYLPLTLILTKQQTYILSSSFFCLLFYIKNKWDPHAENSPNCSYKCIVQRPQIKCKGPNRISLCTPLDLDLSLVLHFSSLFCLLVYSNGNDNNKCHSCHLVQTLMNWDFVGPWHLFMLIKMNYTTLQSWVIMYHQWMIPLWCFTNNE